MQENGKHINLTIKLHYNDKIITIIAYKTVLLH